ncbi:MAG: prepilin-type N-terminal cleavage/methylation domain-containing protein [Candidatus Omnitrophica bacterium]|nr:prepilin-type N-terminal cleavage/methylation domain-containing protein [Candidatus Omnitrophota bacterium]
MKRNKRYQSGFTLIEVLIVVVIIGVLAALIIPRFTAAPEKAIVAEANQMVGAIARAQQTRTDGGDPAVTGNPLSAANFTSLGMAAPTNAKFAYSVAGTTVTATRTVGATVSTVTYNFQTNVWGCTGAYATATNGGCRLS